MVINLLPECLNRCQFFNFRLIFLLFLFFLLFFLFFLIFFFLFLLFFFFFLFFLLKSSAQDIMRIFTKVCHCICCCFNVFLILIQIVIEFNKLYVLPQSPLSNTVCVEIVLIGFHIFELLLNIMEMFQTRAKFPLLQEGFSSFDDVPLVLQLIQTGLISHKKLQNFFCNMWL